MSEADQKSMGNWSEAEVDVLKQAAASGKGQSTGPRTAHGKRRSSRNALKHGFYAREFVQHILNRQDRKAFNRLLKGLLDDWKPVGHTEYVQTELIAHHLHQYKSIVRFQTTLRNEANIDGYVLESAAITNGGVCDEWRRDLPPLLDLEKLQRCESHYLRLYYRALAELERLQRTRLGEKVLPRLIVDLDG